MVDTVNIGSRPVGHGSPCFVIAEAGVNHNGSVEMACRLVDVARDAGADAVKFQTFDAGRLVTATAPKAEYQRTGSDDAQSQLEMLQRLQLSPEDHRTILDHAARAGIVFLSTPFDEGSVDLLEDLGVPAYKISSGDLTNLPLLTYIAGRRKPMVLSTGMSTLDEVGAAVDAIRTTGNDGIVLLQCVTNYPAAAADVNLRAMVTMREAFGVPVGYSDHTLGADVALASVALGSCVIEKHFTLSRDLEGPDHQASIEPSELADLVRRIRLVESALGSGIKEPAASEAATAAVARRSLVAASDIPAGVVLTEALVAIRRPGTGLPPAMRERVVGRTARVAIPEGTVILLEMLA